MANKITGLRFTTSKKKKKYEVRLEFDDGTVIWKEVSWVEYEVAAVELSKRRKK